MLKQLKVSHGLFFVLIILTLVQIISSCWNIYNHSQNSARMQQIANNYIRINALNDAYSTISSIRSQVWKMSFLMANGDKQMDNSQKIQKIKDSYRKADKDMDRFQQISAKGSEEDARRAKVMRQLYDDAKRLQLANIALLEKHDTSAMANYSSKANPTQELLEKISETNQFISDNVITPAIDTSQEFVNTAIWQSALFIALCIIFTLFAVFWSKKYIINKINQLMVYQSSIAKGDLSVPIHIAGSNEIDNLAKGLADMQDSLSEMIRSVRSSTGNIYTSVQEIALGNNDLSSRTEEQASALEQTAASMEQLTSAVKNNTENAREVASHAANSEGTARHGGELTQKMVETMGLITQSSNKIKEIISVIDGIAFQTNILALNAAVEAARAGTHGQGFAVVASEVRNLALRSADAAKEIKTLIDTSVAHVQAGNRLTDEVDQSIRTMMSAAANAKVTLEEIFRASEEQSRGIEQVSQAISEMDSVTQQNAALVEQSAAASASLEDQVKRLNQIVGFFKVGQEGQTAASSRHAPPSYAASLEYQSGQR